MPELPEIETIKIGLLKKIIGKKIADIEIRSPKNFKGNKYNVIGLKIVGIERKAKLLRLKLSNQKNLLIHLKMSGQLIYIDKKSRVAGGHVSHDWHNVLPNEYTRIIFTFSDQSKLFFNDLRKFGWIRVLNNTDIDKIFSEDFGPEPVSKNFSVDYLLSLAKKIPNRKIKQFLTDQTIIAGIGNIYVDEILFDAKILPARKTKELKLSEWKKIYQSILKILKLGIKFGGTSDSDYVNALGQKGGMQDHLKVYRRTGQKCFGCGGKVKRIAIGGRGTHYCSECQK